MRASAHLSKFLRHARCRSWQNSKSLWPTSKHHAYATSEESPSISIDRSGLFTLDRGGPASVDKEAETPLAKQLKALIQA